MKGPDNPTSQLLPISRNKSCSRTGKEGKTKEVVEDREVKKVVCEELCDKVVCDREAAVGAGGGAGYRIKNKNPATKKNKTKCDRY